MRKNARRDKLQKQRGEIAWGGLEFDATLGFPGEGPGKIVKCRKQGAACGIKGHYHRVRKAPAVGGARRKMEKERKQKEDEWTLCKKDYPSYCSVSVHGHDIDQLVDDGKTALADPGKTGETILSANDEAVGNMGLDVNAFLDDKHAPKKIWRAKGVDLIDNKYDEDGVGANELLTGEADELPSGRAEPIPVVPVVPAVEHFTPKDDPPIELPSFVEEKDHVQDFVPVKIFLVDGEHGRLSWWKRGIDSFLSFFSTTYTEYESMGRLSLTDDQVDEFGAERNVHHPFGDWQFPCGRLFKPVSMWYGKGRVEYLISAGFNSSMNGIVSERLFRELYGDTEVMRRPALTADDFQYHSYQAFLSRVVQNKTGYNYLRIQRPGVIQHTIMFCLNQVVIRDMMYQRAYSVKPLRPRFHCVKNCVENHTPGQRPPDNMTYEQGCSFYGFSRMTPTTCNVDKIYEFNKHFVCTYRTPYWVNNEPVFTVEDRVDGSYRTRFGPCVVHKGVIYGETNHNVRLALRRITCARFPGEPLRENLLSGNQCRFFNSTFPVGRLRAIYQDAFNDFTSMELEALLHHADPHEKKNLRINAMKELKESARIHERLWVRSVWYKMKKDEIAKPGKYPRMIGDLGVPASLQGFRLTAFMKYAMERSPLAFSYDRMGCIQWCTPDCEIEFIMFPKPEALDRVFRKLVNPRGRFYMCIFSDDSCASYRCGNQVVTYNIDISTCDASHGPDVFESFIKMFPPVRQDDAKILVEQCKLPIRIYSTNKEQMFMLTPTRPVLYSGSTITTCINSMASAAIGMCIARCDGSNDLELIASAERCGYVITVERCPTIYDIQFLKHSPARDVNGKIRGLLNLGVLLRLSGTCRGDLPGRGSLKDRAAVFQHSLLQGVYSGVTFPLLRLMRKQFSDVNTDRKIVEIIHRDLCYKVFRRANMIRFSDEEVLRRYQLESDEVDDLKTFANSGIGFFTKMDGPSRVIYRDYGL